MIIAASTIAGALVLNAPTGIFEITLPFISTAPISLPALLGVTAYMIATVLGIWHLAGLDRILLIVACAIYLFGVHVPTVAVNIPLNNDLQSKDLDAMSESELLAITENFDSRWLPWNSLRTVIATLTTLLLLVLLVRL